VNSDRLELARLAVAGLNRRERAELLRTFAASATKATEPPALDRILRRGEVARLLARSPRAVDRLAADGVLRRVTLPGRARAAGFRLHDVQTLIGEGC
jgi:hypothetical protein